MKLHSGAVSFLILLVSLHFSLAQNIEVGMSRDDVLKLLGRPNGGMRSGQNEMMLFAGGSVFLIDGKVDHFEFKAEPKQSPKTEHYRTSSSVQHTGSQDVNLAMKSIVMVQAGNTRGSAFVTMIDNRRYLVTNAHVLTKGKSVAFITADGRNIVNSLSSYDFAEGRDLVRIFLPDGLKLASLPLASLPPKVNEPIVAIGNSLGQGAVAVSHGKVVGLGSDRFEIDADIVGGNSGGPILNSRGEVLGVATYVTRHPPNWVTQGTRFTEARRWALTLENTRWRSFQKQSVLEILRYVEDLHTFCDDYLELMSIHTDPPQAFSKADAFRSIARKQMVPGKYTNADFATRMKAIAEGFADWASANDAQKREEFISANDRAMLNLDAIILQAERLSFPSDKMKEESDSALDYIKIVRDWHQGVLARRR
jgi:hypothetical protein